MSRRHHTQGTTRQSVSEEAQSERSEDNAGDAPPIAIEAMSVLGAVQGLVVACACGLAFCLAPSIPSVPQDSWYAGIAILPKIVLFTLILFAGAIVVHVGIWLPAKVLFAAAYGRRKIEEATAHHAFMAAILAIVALVAVSPSIVTLFSAKPNEVKARRALSVIRPASNPIPVMKPEPVQPAPGQQTKLPRLAQKTR